MLSNCDVFFMYIGFGWSAEMRELVRKLSFGDKKKMYEKSYGFECGF